MNSILTSLLLTPLIGAGIVLLMPSAKTRLIRSVSLIALALLLLGTLYIYFSFSTASAPLQQEAAYRFVEKYSWIHLALGNLGNLQINYFLGVDGLSVGLLLLTGIVMFTGGLASWNITKNVKAYYALYLLLAAAVSGCFIALDFFLFYLFFELMLLPMYFLIGIWGGPKREYASIKFFLYTLLGSVFILVAMIGLYLSVIDPAATANQLGLSNSVTHATEEVIAHVQDRLASGVLKTQNRVHSFSLLDMLEVKNFIPGSLLDPARGAILLGVPARFLAFLLLLLGFLIKMPSVPLHTWLPDAHVEAPTPVSVVLAGILLKIGAYGLIRIAFPIFPEAALYYSGYIAAAGVLSIIYGAMCALAQKDLKRLIAYSSVSHMGFVLLGLTSFTPEGTNGALYQLFSHGLIASLLFLISGVLYERTQDRQISNYRGLAQAMPLFTAFVVLAFFAALGLPGLSGFIAEVLVLLGAFASSVGNGLLPVWLVLIALLGLLIGAAYALWTIQRMFFGTYWHFQKSNTSSKLTDLHRLEIITMAPLALLIIVFGLFPDLLLRHTSGTVMQWLTHCTSQGSDILQQVRSYFP